MLRGDHSAESQKNKKAKQVQLKSIDDPTYQNNVPKMGKFMPGIRRSIVIRIVHIFAISKLIKNDHLIDIHVNTEVLTTGLVILSGKKRSLAVASSQ